MNTRWILAAAVSCSVLVAPAFAQQADDAKAVLAESSKAMKEAKNLTFEGKRFATGMLKDFIDCSGTVKIFRPEGAKAPMVMCTGRIKQPAAADKQLTYSQDGTTARWLDQKENKLFERAANDSLAVQEYGLVKQIMPEDYLLNEPFSQIMKMDKLTKLPSDNVKGEVCDIVQGASADGMRKVTWAFSVKDHLPRRMEMATGSGENVVSMILEVANVNTAATLTAKDFDIAMPTGYTLDKGATASVPTSAAPGNPAPDVQLGLKPAEPAPNFVLKDVSGGEVSLASMKGKVVVLEFFGSMFKASTIGSIDLNSIASEMKDKNVKVLGLACREASEGTAKEYFKNNNLSYTLVPKADAAVTDYNIKGFPSYYVITPSGKIGSFFQSYPGKDAMVSAITQAGEDK